MANQIVLENEKQGTPETVWRLTGPPSANIEGFATDISVDVGDSLEFKINTTASEYRIDIYRLGYYGGDGARLVHSIQHQNGVVQPAPLSDTLTGLVDAANWQVTDSWDIPSDAVSGVYIANLIREDGVAGQSQIPFIVRNDESSSEVVFQTSDTNWHAYNNWGGNSFYTSTNPPAGQIGTPRAYAVSYNRPLSVDNGPNSVLGVEYNAIRWLEKNGFDVSYIAGVDASRSGDLLLNHKVYLDAGHDEYWSAEQRTAIEQARDAGVNLQFWSGNEAFWQVRWDNEYRTLICYKESMAGAHIDPSEVWTGTWRDPMSPNGSLPENALTGTLFMVDAFRSDTINVPYEFAQFRFWDNTSIAQLKPGETGSLSLGTLGYEWDVDADNGFRPAGLINLSLTSISTDTKQLLPNYTSIETRVAGEATHSLTLYKASSGALVFGAGTIWWALNLEGESPSRDAQQAMINLFAEMGVQPATLQSDLVAAIASDDHQAPISSIKAYTGAVGRPLILGGKAVDSGGGVVAGVEVSTDGGFTWHEAFGRDSWLYSWIPETEGTYDIIARATDDSLNLGGHTSTSVTVKEFDDVLVDDAFYFTLQTDVLAASLDADAHFSQYGWTEGRDPNSCFDTLWYLWANPDVAAASINPLDHFQSWGWREGRNPSPSFDLQLYLQANTDVASAGINPLEHYLQFGRAEGRTSYANVEQALGSGFDFAHYVSAYPNVAVGDAFVDFNSSGWKQGRDPNPYFDTAGYLAAYRDVAEAGINPLDHYMYNGAAEGRDPSAEFDTAAYLELYPDVAAAGINPLGHFLQYGIAEGRVAVSDGIFG